MSEERLPVEHLPAAGTDTPVCREVGDAGALQVCHDVVYLPHGREIPVESAQFTLLLRENLPPDLGGDVAAQLRAEQGKATALERLFSLFLLLAAALLLWYFFPETTQRELKNSEMQLHDDLPPMHSLSPYYAAYQNNMRRYRFGEYATLLRETRGDVHRIAANHEKDNYPLPLLYFQAMLKLKDRADATDRDALKRLGDSEPDRLCWKQLEFAFNPLNQKFMDVLRLKKELRSYKENWRTALSEIDAALREIADMRRCVQLDNGRQATEFGEYLALCESRLLTSKWLLLGSRGATDRLGDDFDDPGVAEREAALQLAMRHGNGTERGFWELRRFIAQTILEQSYWFNHYYWNGRENSGDFPLEDELNRCREKLSAGVPEP